MCFRLITFPIHCISVLSQSDSDVEKGKMDVLQQWTTSANGMSETKAKLRKRREFRYSAVVIKRQSFSELELSFGDCVSCRY